MKAPRMLHLSILKTVQVILYSETIAPWIHEIASFDQTGSNQKFIEYKIHWIIIDE